MAGGATVAQNLRAMKGRVRAAVKAVALREAAEMEAEAKKNASWNDKSGKARQGLVGIVEETPDTIETGVAHTMDYGVYLELRQGPGRRDILQPTRDEHVRPFFDGVRRLLEP